MTHVGLFGRKRTADAADQPPAGTEAVNVRITWFVKRSITDTVLLATFAVHAR